MSSNINSRYSLGKGEVVSSILTGSTRKAHETGAFHTAVEPHPAVHDGTEHEHDSSTRGKSVESVRQAFRGWATGKPAPIRNIASSLTAQLSQARRYPHIAALRAIIGRNVERLGGAG